MKYLSKRSMGLVALSTGITFTILTTSIALADTPMDEQTGPVTYYCMEKDADGNNVYKLGGDWFYLNPPWTQELASADCKKYGGIGVTTTKPRVQPSSSSAPASIWN